MAIKLKWTSTARGELKALLAPVLAERAEKVADACNAESSWGFYQAYPHEDAARVAALNQRSDARTNRLIRNLKAGRL